MGAKEKILKYLEYKKVSLRDFYRQTGLSNGFLKSGTHIGSDNLKTIISHYPDLNLEWVVMDIGEMIRKPSTEKTEPRIVNLPVVSDAAKPIPLTSISAAAGYGALNEEHWDSSDIVHLPNHLLKKDGHHIAVRIKGDSMSPTLQDGGYVIIRHLDGGDWDKFPNEQVGVVVDADGKTYLKRIKNRFKQGFITLMSDNPDKVSYPNFNLHRGEILHLWIAVWYLSAKMPNIHDQYYNRLQRMEDRYDDLEAKYLGLETLIRENLRLPKS